MSKYFKAEDVINTLADQWRFEATMDSPYASNDINDYLENAKLLFSDLPTIEVSEDNEPTFEQVKDYCFKRDYAIVSRAVLYDEIVNLISDIAPSVVPTTEQSSKVGEWRFFTGVTLGRPLDEFVRCSECGYEPRYKDIGILPTNLTLHFCPNCGAKMKG